MIAARERIGLAALAIERARRGTLARMRRSRLLRWQHRAPVADDLLLAPPDLRPQDPSFVDEIESGSFGLSGLTVQLRGASPFAVPPPSQAWARELHGFGWLRHFGAAWSLENEATARQLVAEWIRRQAPPRGSCLGARGGGPAHHFVAVACGDDPRRRRAAALRRHHAEPGRPGHLSFSLLAQRARRLSATAGPDRAGAGRPVHRRPRAPARPRGTASCRRTGAPDPARRRPCRAATRGCWWSCCSTCCR